jgi:ribose transport system permease protein
MLGTAKFLRSSLTSVAGPLAALLLAVVVISLTTDRFMMGRNLSNVSLQVSSVAIAAIGATLVILTGGIDLSPGATVALTSCTLAILAKNNDIPVAIAIPMTLLLGALLGFVNGFFSTYGRIPSFVATLATMSVYRGLAFLITKGSPIFSVSPDLDPVFYDEFLGLPLPLYYVVTLYLITLVFLRFTVPGRMIYAVGGNESAARLSGIQVNRTRLLAFVLAGLTASIAYGVGTELQAIAAAVIGGASLTGGHGNIVSTLFGALTVAVVQNGLNLNAVPSSWQEITIGSIIVLAVGIDMWRTTISQRATQLIPLLRKRRE